jgi:NurA-like 5'-3' nuclease
MEDDSRASDSAAQIRLKELVGIKRIRFLEDRIQGLEADIVRERELRKEVELERNMRLADATFLLDVNEKLREDVSQLSKAIKDVIAKSKENSKTCNRKRSLRELRCLMN